MSAQLKTDPAPIDNTQGERRRGAAGRAAALRRAPSDSDCSGETASLSADSGERRPPPPPPRSGKTRSRRRGSEWEVLEGLKDGQRFERRPEVFNGFLHKKRKWPLKGWHKRFFVVDGGILVYARSPNDVARGRLHGSLDVGLSVISAKPRRRRIDIDADEFIYHLRAKTPDVFRTWLNVLKAHRLYRQHLLTFGARESVPKIHAPNIDDLPPTDTSSRTSQSSIESFTSSILSPRNLSPASKRSHPNIDSIGTITSVYNTNSLSTLECRRESKSDNSLNFCDCLSPNNTNEKLKHACNELWSMYFVEEKLGTMSQDFKTTLSADEEQTAATNLDMNTLTSSSLKSNSVLELKSTGGKLDALLNKHIAPEEKLKSEAYQELLTDVLQKSMCENENPLWSMDKNQMTMFLFSRKSHRSRIREEQWTMRKSKKSTNLVRYRNVIDEPCMSTPIKHMILCKNKNHCKNRYFDGVGVMCDLSRNYKSKEVSTQDAATTWEYDLICEKLIFSLFGNPDVEINSHEDYVISNLCVKQVVKELYDLNMTDSKTHPIRFLFKSLLQFYLKYTEGKFKGSAIQDKAITKQSIEYFTRNKAISSHRIDTTNKEVQTSSSMRNKLQAGSQGLESEKISSQELEEFVKSTVYYCTNVQGKKRGPDIKITKSLIDDLDTLSRNCVKKHSGEVSELQEILEDTIKHLLSESSLSKAVTDDLLNYLGNLHRGTSTCSPSTELSVTDSSNTSEPDYKDPICDIQTECIQKTISRSITTFDPIKSSLNDGTENNIPDAAQFFKEIIDKMTSLFTSKKVDSKSNLIDLTNNNGIDYQVPVEEELKRFADDHSCKHFAQQTRKNYEVRLSKDKVSMSNDAAMLRIKSLSIKSEEKSLNSKKSSLKSISSKNYSIFKSQTSDIETTSNQFKPCYQVILKTKSPFKSVYTHTGEMDLQKYSSSSVATSNTYFQGSESIECNNWTFSNSKTDIDQIQFSPNGNNINDDCYSPSFVQNRPVALHTKNNLESVQKLPPGDFVPLEGKERTPKIIDERFILCLLENLTLLSKNIPSMHDPILNLYFNLKSKHDKVTENLLKFSLIRNVYGENWTPRSLNEQIEEFPKIRNNIYKRTVQVAINTSFILPGFRKGVDKALSVLVFDEAIANVRMRRQLLDTTNVKLDDSNFPRINDDGNERKTETDDKDEWFKQLTKEYAKNAMIKNMLVKCHLPQSIHVSHPIKATIPEVTTLARNLSKINRLSRISPPLKVSTQSQTRREGKLTESSPEMYHSFLDKKFESLTDTGINLKSDKSDDLITIYRCSSDPSYCSTKFVV